MANRQTPIRMKTSISLKILISTLAQAEITVEAETTLRKSLRSFRSCKAMGHSLPWLCWLERCITLCWHVDILTFHMVRIQGLPASHAATKLPWPNWHLKPLETRKFQTHLAPRGPWPQVMASGRKPRCSRSCRCYGKWSVCSWY